MPAVAFSVGTALPNPIYVDSNVAIAFFYRTHTNHIPATTFFLEAAKQARQLFFSALSMDELWHVLMGKWHWDATSVKFDPSKAAHVGRWCTDVRQVTEKLLQLSNVRLCPPHPSMGIVTLALGALQTCSLGARDAFHMAFANTAGSPAIATMDSDFDRALTAQPEFIILRVA